MGTMQGVQWSYQHNRSHFRVLIGGLQSVGHSISAGNRSKVRRTKKPYVL